MSVHCRVSSSAMGDHIHGNTGEGYILQATAAHTDNLPGLPNSIDELMQPNSALWQVDRLRCADSYSAAAMWLETSPESRKGAGGVVPHPVACLSAGHPHLQRVGSCRCSPNSADQSRVWAV